MKAAEREALLGLLGRLRGRRALVVGDVMLDRFVWGEVDRISPEAPVPVVRVSRETAHLGGAANVAANLASLGVEVTLAGLVGDDAAGAQVRQMLAEASIESVLLPDTPGATTVKTRIIARAQQVVRVDRESAREAAADLTGGLARELRAILPRAEVVVVSDYNKGALSGPVLPEALPEARRLGLPVVVDPKRSDFSIYQPATVVTPNQSEAARASGLEIRTDADCVGAARRILEGIDVSALLVTRGERGMLLLERGREPALFPTVAREVYDVTGAGDTVVSVLAASLAAGGTLREAAILANVAAGIVVGKVGTATAGTDEIRDRIGSLLPEEHP